MPISECEHRTCSREKRVWLPSTYNKYGSIEKHPWCVDCGTVKNISDDRPKSIGYWMSKLAEVSLQLNLTQCQKRIIAKEIESYECFRDTFGTFGSNQKELFIKIIESHYDTSSVDFDTLLWQ